MELKRAIIFVTNLLLMTEFYRDKLGLRPILEGATPEWIEFDAGGTRISLHAIPEGIAKEIGTSAAPRVREEMPTKLVFAVADVEAERARLLALGVRMLELKSWGACDGVDPEGNVFQIDRA